ncbi:cupredoxin domain-containing protein [Ramlibacter albus]|uniref:Cupredoxin family protein n=1 Tax=Ramlibacter albus TaxID=2079448 RepID=A0A923S320_9BURK|nr:cupredoxin family protein [Ramlibacter albus]MBC5765951.1 cupredoxin family protein [Ramlibacter albus]
MKIIAAAMALSMAVPFAQAQSRTHSAHAAPEQKAWGVAGNAKAVTRTIRVSMTDAMRFAPERIEVKRGETIRFVVANQGRLLHELVLGTQQELDAHAAMMARHPGMEHDDPGMVHVRPGRKGSLVWHFNRAGEFRFACLIDGHYQAGMVGTLIVN